MFWTSKPTIIVKCISEDKYTWVLYLSNNKKRPSCVSPTTYKDAFRCRAAAKQFASKFKGPMKITDVGGKNEEIIYIDETKNKPTIDEDTLE
jgi:hypothetical protein